MADKPKPLTDDEIKSSVETIEGVMIKLKQSELSALLGFAHTGLHGAVDALNGEIANRAKTKPVA